MEVRISILEMTLDTDNSSSRTNHAVNGTSVCCSTVIINAIITAMKFAIVKPGERGRRNYRYSEMGDRGLTLL